MSITFGSAGAAAVGVSSLSVAYPASIAAGDLLILCIASKAPPNSPTTPDDWTLPSGAQGSGGSGTDGFADEGNVYCSVYVKEAVGDESGSLAVTITSGNGAIGRMFRYTKAADKTWGYAASNGADNSAGTSWSATAAGDPGLTAGDMLIVASATNSDNQGPYSAEAVTATGISAWGTVTEQQDSGTNQGSDVAMCVSEHPVSTGTSSAPPVFTMTATASTANAPTGASVFLRLREVSTGGSIDNTANILSLLA